MLKRLICWFLGHRPNLGYMKCRHKNRTYAQFSISEGMHIASTDIVGAVEKEVYYCKDCRVLFVPWESERIVGLHEVRDEAE